MVQVLLSLARLWARVALAFVLLTLILPAANGVSQTSDPGSCYEVFPGKRSMARGSKLSVERLVVWNGDVTRCKAVCDADDRCLYFNHNRQHKRCYFKDATAIGDVSDITKHLVSAKFNDGYLKCKKEASKETTCNLPISGTWRRPDGAELTITGDKLRGPVISISSNVYSDFACWKRDGDKYIFRQEGLTDGDRGKFKAYFCWMFDKLDSGGYRLYQLTNVYQYPGSSSRMIPVWDWETERRPTVDQVCSRAKDSVTPDVIQQVTEEGEVTTSGVPDTTNGVHSSTTDATTMIEVDPTGVFGTTSTERIFETTSKETENYHAYKNWAFNYPSTGKINSGFDVDGCKARCDREGDRCLSFVYDTFNGMCWFKATTKDQHPENWTQRLERVYYQKKAKPSVTEEGGVTTSGVSDTTNGVHSPTTGATDAIAVDPTGVFGTTSAERNFETTSKETGEGCMVKGRLYEIGDRIPVDPSNPCIVACRCSWDGQPECASVECPSEMGWAQLPCGDKAVRLPGHCCPSCPDGVTLTTGVVPGTTETTSGDSTQVTTSATDKEVTLQNVAVGKPATQSSQNAAYSAGYAVDGNDTGSCSKTKAPKKISWLRVDLLSEYTVHSVVITGCPWGKGLQNLAVYVDDAVTTGGSGEPCVTVAAVANGATVEYTCTRPVTGRYVTVVHKDAELAVRELQIMAEPKEVMLQNVALGKPAEQSSTYKSYNASSAVDGDASSYWNFPAGTGSCTHTSGEGEKWLRVDLLGEYTVQGVQLSNRAGRAGSRLKDFTVYVDDAVTTVGSGRPCVTVARIANGATVEYTCTQPMKGRYVTVTLPTDGNVLTICELVVIGVTKEVMCHQKKTTTTTTTTTPETTPETTTAETTTTTRPETTPETTTAETTTTTTAETTTTTTRTETTIKTSTKTETPKSFDIKLVNVAVGKTASQSSTLRGPKGDADHWAAGKAVDGSADPDYHNGSCSQTDAETRPWWRVDLGESWVVHAVRITNVGNHFAWVRTRDFSVYVSADEEGTRRQTCVDRPEALQRGETKTFTCPQPITGRFVTMEQYPSWADHLNICEFEVLAEPKEATASPAPDDICGRTKSGKSCQSWRDFGYTYEEGNRCTLKNHNEPWCYYDYSLYPQGWEACAETCAPEVVAVDVWGMWTEWGACSVTCDEGQRSRSRPCITAPGTRGQPRCQGQGTEVEECNEGCCPDKDETQNEILN